MTAEWKDVVSFLHPSVTVKMIVKNIHDDNQYSLVLSTVMYCVVPSTDCGFGCLVFKSPLLVGGYLVCVFFS